MYLLSGDETVVSDVMDDELPVELDAVPSAPALREVTNAAQLAARARAEVLCD